MVFGYQHDLLKLVFAAILGSVLGLEREIKRKPMGLKTCLVISITSALLTIVSVDTSYLVSTINGAIRSDPMRLTAQIVSGIGFLGAGVILHRNNEVVSGLTTAAIVWASAAIGIACGAGFYIDAAVGVLLLMLSVELLPRILNRIGPRVLREKEVQLTLTLAEHIEISAIVKQIKALEIRIESIQSNLDTDDHKREVVLHCIVEDSRSMTNVFSELIVMEGISRVETRTQ